MHALVTTGERRWRLVPFAAAAFLPFALVALPTANWYLPELLGSAALTLLVGVLILLAPPTPRHSTAPVAVAFLYLLAIALLRDAARGPSVGVASLTLLPLFWLSLYGTRTQLGLTELGMALFFFVPVITAGAPQYPVSSVRGGIVFLAVAGIVGVTVQRLVGRVRAQAIERELLLAQLDQLAHTDSLTGLPNRRAWEAELAVALERAGATGEPLAVAILDLDTFKAYNDACGHDAGDRLLAAIAAAWREALGDRYVLARLGGDEFAIALPAASAPAAARVLSELRAATPAGHTFSAGITVRQAGEDYSGLMRRTDDSLYDAKRLGRDRIAIASDSEPADADPAGARSSAPARSAPLTVR